MTLGRRIRTFGKIYSTSHVRADRWYRIGRTILYGQLEDETPIGSVRRLVILEDYALRFLRDAGIRVAARTASWSSRPNAEYMLVTEFFEDAKTLGDSEVDEVVIDEGMVLIRQLWDLGVAHRDIKPANLLVKDGHLQLVDVSGLGDRPSPWRQAVDLANMMLTLGAPVGRRSGVRAGGPRLHADEIAEGFACAVGLAIPTQLQARLKADERPLFARFKELAPSKAPISIQRWSARRIGTSGDRCARRAHACRVARGLGTRRAQLRARATEESRRRLRINRFGRLTLGHVIAPPSRTPRGHDLRDSRHQEELPEDGLHHGETLPGVLARHEVAVSGRRERHEAEEQVVADGAVTLWTEERRCLDRPDRLVDECERDADAQVGGDGAQHRFAIHRAPERDVTRDRERRDDVQQSTRER